MKEKLKDDKFAKELLYKFISILIIAIVALLLLNAMTQNKDGRMQIVDEDGASEYSDIDTGPSAEERRLAEILSDIKGVGKVDVMITYEGTKTEQSVFANDTSSDKGRVRGVIVTASGADSPIIKNDIMKAVAAVFDIPIQNVMVFEKNEEGL